MATKVAAMTTLSRSFLAIKNCVTVQWWLWSWWFTKQRERNRRCGNKKWSLL
ncbi:hypothetical protein HanRHA438_Chr10g0461621 [Helianthus annuus]|nr:hypothetical protein HanRHA438_Chr10g0461621 [Helianthus annuus]